jgi:uncharacterized protein (TIGR03437 family)
VVVWAFAGGPPAHKTGVPGTGESTCVECHVGTPLNGGGGNVTITAEGGNTYTPGQAKTLTIQINDATARYGFQATARLAGDRNQQAGSFTAGAGQEVQCASADPNDFGGACSGTRTIEFIQHSSPFQTGTITVNWTAPDAPSGNVEIYVSANAANGNGQPTGDRIYNASLTLEPAAGGTRPAISEGGIINAAQFGAQAGVAPGTWVEIYGENLSTTTREWTVDDFDGNTAPTSLDGVSVTFAGKPGFIRFISPGQINAQVPDDIGTGPIPVVVTNSNGAGEAMNFNADSTLPGLYAPFTADGRQYVGAFNADGTAVGSPGNPAVKPGDQITFYGIGFGPVDPAVPAGQIASGQPGIVNPPTVRIGGTDAATTYRGLTPGAIGLYQFNLTVPDLADGDHAVTVDGTDQSLFITIQR